MNQLTAPTKSATERRGSLRLAKIAAAASMLFASQVSNAGLVFEMPSPLPDASKQAVRGTQASPSFSNSEVVESVRPRRQLDLTSQLTQRIRQKGIPPRELPPIIGAGYDVTIADALKQIVPGGWMVFSEHDFPEDMAVNWQGNRNWPMTLNTVLMSADMKAEIDWERGEVTLSKARPAPARSVAPPAYASVQPLAQTAAPAPALAPAAPRSPADVHQDTIAKARAHLATKAAQGDKSAQAAHDALSSGAVVTSANQGGSNTPVIVVVQQPAPQPAPIIVQQPAPAAPTTATATAPVVANAQTATPAPAQAPVQILATAQAAPAAASGAPAQSPQPQAPVVKPVPAVAVAQSTTPAAASALPTEIEHKKLVAYKPAPTWKLNKDMFLRENIRAWAESEGWTLEWQATVGESVINYPINADAELRGELIGEGGVIHRLIAKYERADEPLGVRFYRGNRVVVVFPYSKTTTSYEQK